MVFDGFRRSFDDLLARATKPEDRRAVAARMKDTLVQARVGLDDLRTGVEQARRRLAAEEQELETVRRRKQLAEGINDRETVEIAAKYEQMHVERADVLRQKLSAQEAELSLAEREVAQMSAELKAVLSGADVRSVSAAPEAAPDTGDASLRDELDSLGRARARADLESEAARKLDELKRRMGK
jgi:MarR-like DNA-binding transcriptional regulator SgrR of sgrS sRNA